MGKERVTYKDLIEAVISSYEVVTNVKLAIKLANDVEGLDVDERGEIVKGGTLKEFMDLVNYYKRIAGPVALTISRRAIAPLIESSKIRDELPEELK